MSDSFALRLVRARTTSCRSPSRGRSRSRNDHFPRPLESRRWTRPIPTNRSFERDCWNFGCEWKERYLFTWRWKRTFASAESSVNENGRTERGRRGERESLYNRFFDEVFTNTTPQQCITTHSRWVAVDDRERDRPSSSNLARVKCSKNFESLDLENELFPLPSS